MILSRIVTLQILHTRVSGVISAQVRPFSLRLLTAIFSNHDNVLLADLAVIFIPRAIVFFSLFSDITTPSSNKIRWPDNDAPRLF